MPTNFSMLPDQTPTDYLSKGEVFEVLRNQRRRFVLQYLKQDDRPVELGDLAQQVAAWEYETTLDAVTPEQRKRVYTTLQQTHLPKMDESGILEFDSDAGVIEATDRTRDISVYLEIVPGHEFDGTESDPETDPAEADSTKAEPADRETEEAEDSDIIIA